MNRLLLVAAALLMLVSLQVKAYTYDNPTATSIANSGIAIDGNLSDWGTAGVNYTQTAAWNEWFDGNYDGVYTPHDAVPGTTTSRMAIDTAHNRLMLGIQSTQPILQYEIGGLFGGTDIAGKSAKTVVGTDATQFWFFWGAPARTTGSALALYQNEVYRNGANVGQINLTGIAGAYSYDGTTLNVELSIPIKKDWTSADASLANTWDLSDPATQIAFNADFFCSDVTWIGFCQAARFDGTHYGAADNTKDFWNVRTSNVTGEGTTGGLTTMTCVVPEPATMSLLALGGLAMIRRRK